MNKEQIMQESNRRYPIPEVRVGESSLDRAFQVLQQEAFEQGANWYASTIQQQGMVEQSHPYQLCPKCDGQGTVSKPPYLPAGVDEWTSSESSWQCDVCNGDKVLKPFISHPSLNSKLLEALTELVELKDIKDEIDKDEMLTTNYLDYAKRKPLAWQAAREIIKSIK